MYEHETEWELANYDIHEAYQDYLDFRRIYESESMRGKILVTLGFLESLLAKSIKNFLVDDDPALLKRFASRTLGSLDAKLNLAFLLGIVDGREHKMIEKMAKIRNDFAHQVHVKEGDADLENHIRDLARLANVSHYHGDKSDNRAEEVWGMAMMAITPFLINRPARAVERRLTFDEWEVSAP